MNCSARLILMVMTGTLISTSGLVLADALLAFDNAAESAYSDGWQTGDNGGENWGGNWNLTTSVNPPDVNLAGFQVGSSQNNGFNDGNINSSGLSLGLYANSSHSALATRPFSGTLGIGQSVIIDMDNGFIDTDSRVGFTLTGFGDPMSTEQFSFYFVGGDDTYRTSTGQFVFQTESDTGVNFTSAGLQIIFTLTAEDAYSLAITPNGGSTTSMNGNFLIPAEIDHIELYNYNAGSGAANDAFFNNIQIVPEPSTSALLLLGLAGFLKMRRRS